jgi:hypothetical protein
MLTIWSPDCSRYVIAVVVANPEAKTNAGKNENENKNVKFNTVQDSSIEP